VPPVLCPHECKPRLLRARGAPFRAPSVLSIARASGLRPPAPWRLSLWLVLVPSPVVIQDACPPLLDADSLSQALARRSCLGAYRTDVFRDPLLTGASPMRACSASGSAPIIRVCSGSLPRPHDLVGRILPSSRFSFVKQRGEFPARTSVPGCNGCLLAWSLAPNRLACLQLVTSQFVAGSPSPPSLLCQLRHLGTSRAVVPGLAIQDAEWPCRPRRMRIGGPEP